MFKWLKNKIFKRNKVKPRFEIGDTCIWRSDGNKRLVDVIEYNIENDIVKYIVFEKYTGIIHEWIEENELTKFIINL